MSDIIIKNPENLAIDPRMEYVIRCVKEVVTKRGDDPRSVTGFVRGKAFYGELSHAMSDATVLDWADSQFIFHDDEYIHGLQLYDTVTGIYLGIVSIFDISALHHSQHPECVSAGCAHGGKRDSIVIAITSKAVRRRARSQLQMNNGLGGSFSDSTNMISVKNLTSLTHKGDKWYGKGVGKRILSTIDSILSTVLFGNLPADDRHLGMTRGALRSSVGNFTREYRDAVAEFFDHIDTSKYNPATAQSILPEFIFDKDFYVYHWHKEGFSIPRDCTLLAKGKVFENQAFVYGKDAYGIQFHPEVTLTQIIRWTGDDTGKRHLKHIGAQRRSEQVIKNILYTNKVEKWLENFLDKFILTKDS